MLVAAFFSGFAVGTGWAFVFVIFGSPYQASPQPPLGITITYLILSELLLGLPIRGWVFHDQFDTSFRKGLKVALLMELYPVIVASVVVVFLQLGVGLSLLRGMIPVFSSP